MANQLNLKTYKTRQGENLLYSGKPDLEKLDHLANGPGDVWHSSADQGFNDCFPELIYQAAVYWWFINDFKGTQQAVNWRINPEAFVARESVWQAMKGLDISFRSPVMASLDFGFNLLRNQGGIPLYIKGLFPPMSSDIEITAADRYRFYLKNFKGKHAIYMMMRRGFLRIFSEWKGFKRARQNLFILKREAIPLRPLQPIKGEPTVSLVIPTMKRQHFTELLLQDHNNQTYPIKEAVIVDATPEEERNPKYYDPCNFEFEIKVKWQNSKGSCRARNEAIALCTGDYILFADDDIRVLPDFVENHIRMLQTYNASAANGLDIMATSMDQGLDDLIERLDKLGDSRWKAGVSHMFSNANSIVSRDLVDRLVGNDVNFDGGYGEDADFGLRILKSGAVLLFNPYSPNLHLKPPEGGYRFWGNQSRIIGKKRKPQPWELNKPVGWIRPVPSPTITYGVLKHYTVSQIKEWRFKYVLNYLLKPPRSKLFFRIFNFPYKWLQLRSSMGYAKRLIKLGERYS